MSTILGIAGDSVTGTSIAGTGGSTGRAPPGAAAAAPADGCWQTAAAAAVVPEQKAIPLPIAAVYCNWQQLDTSHTTDDTTSYSTVGGRLGDLAGRSS